MLVLKALDEVISGFRAQGCNVYERTNGNFYIVLDGSSLFLNDKVVNFYRGGAKNLYRVSITFHKELNEMIVLFERDEERIATTKRLLLL